MVSLDIQRELRANVKFAPIATTWSIRRRKASNMLEMISEVIKFQNGMVMVFDEKGKQMPDFQGRYEGVRVKILAHAPRGAKFFHGVWLNPLDSTNAVSREESTTAS